MSQWDLLEGGHGLLAAVRDGATLAFREGSELAGARIDAEVEQAGPKLVVPGPPGVAAELIACRAAGTLAAGGEEAAFDGPALRWAGDEDGPLRRSISILLEDGELIALRALGKEAGKHGEEARAAAFTSGDHQIAAAEVLLSTEYGADGVQRRATLELWPDHAKSGLPLRGAGTLLCSARVEDAGISRTVAFFRWSVDGRVGIGSYEIARAA